MFLLGGRFFSRHLFLCEPAELEEHVPPPDFQFQLPSSFASVSADLQVAQPHSSYSSVPTEL
jgi:hypothetical protein